MVVALSSRDKDVIIIGEKSPGSYALEVLHRFRSGGKRIVLKAYGHNISKAAYVADTLRRVTGGKVAYCRIALNSEELGEETEEKCVPTIEIEMLYEG